MTTDDLSYMGRDELVDWLLEGRMPADLKRCARYAFRDSTTDELRQLAGGRHG